MSENTEKKQCSNCANFESMCEQCLRGWCTLIGVVVVESMTCDSFFAASDLPFDDNRVE